MSPRLQAMSPQAPEARVSRYGNPCWGWTHAALTFLAHQAMQIFAWTSLPPTQSPITRPAVLSDCALPMPASTGKIPKLSSNWIELSSNRMNHLPLLPSGNQSWHGPEIYGTGFLKLASDNKSNYLIPPESRHKQRSLTRQILNRRLQPR